MKQAQFEIATSTGPETVVGWRMTEYFGAFDGVRLWSLTHLPTGCRVSGHRSLEACLARAVRLERRCGEALASTDVVAIACAISPRLAARRFGRREAHA